MSGVMQNFRKIADGVAVAPLLEELAEHPELWGQHPHRVTTPGSPHSQASDIWMRFNEAPRPGHAVNELETVWYPAADVLQHTRALVFAIMALSEGTRLGRVLVTRLPPGGRIAAHCDERPYADYYLRYHVCLQATAGSRFRCGNETVEMMPGELWWFLATENHEVVNNGDVERIHLLIDVHTE